MYSSTVLAASFDEPRIIDWSAPQLFELTMSPFVVINRLIMIGNLAVLAAVKRAPALYEAPRPVARLMVQAAAVPLGRDRRNIRR